jgi:hypothetical protein
MAVVNGSTAPIVQGELSDWNLPASNPPDDILFINHQNTSSILVTIPTAILPESNCLAG